MTPAARSTNVSAMGIRRRARGKVMEWVRRYLPNELAGWTAEIGSAVAAYQLTGSYAAAVVAGTIGSSAGYYATAYVNGVRWAYRSLAGRNLVIRMLLANGLAVRSIAVEFGPAEAIDSIVVRPAALFAGPFLVGSTALGWVLGSLAADLAFYVFAIFSYERFSTLLVRRPTTEEVTDGCDGPVTSVAAA